jgi:hypothetical protein
MIILEISKAINIAIGCVTASALEMDEKREVIGKLRTIEGALEEISDALDGQKATPLVERLAYILSESGLYDKD